MLRLSFLSFVMLFFLLIVFSALSTEQIEELLTSKRKRKLVDLRQHTGVMENNMEICRDKYAHNCYMPHI